jgi:hypothetical protein
MTFTLTYLGCERVRFARMPAASDRRALRRSDTLRRAVEAVLEKLRDAWPPFDHVDVIWPRISATILIRRRGRYLAPNSHFVSTTQATVQVMEATTACSAIVYRSAGAGGRRAARCNVHIQVWIVARKVLRGRQHLGFVVTLGDVRSFTWGRISMKIAFGG